MKLNGNVIGHLKTLFRRRNRGTGFQIQMKCYDSSVSCTFKSKFRDLSFPQSTVNELLWNRLDKWPDKIAVECGVTGASFTYAQLKKGCERFAASLLKFGLRKNDIVTVLLPNTIEFPIVFLGIFEAGLQGTCVNPVYSVDEIAWQIKDSNSTFVITIPSKVPTVQEVAVKLKTTIQIIVVGETNDKDPVNFPRFHNLIGNNVDATNLSALRHPTDPSETALIPYSSGTTGLPKGVCLTHRSMVSNVVQTCSSDIESIPETTSDRQASVPCIVPFFHIYGFSVVMYRSLFQGAKIIVLPKFQPDTFLNVLTSNKDIIFHSVPPMIFFLNTYSGIEKKHLENLKLTLVGGAPCSPKDIEKLLDRKPHRIGQIYGMTEGSPLFTNTPKTQTISDSNLRSCGVLLSNTEARIVDTVTGKNLPENQSGEMCFRGPQVMKGYFHKPKETAKTIDSDGWIHTGDIGYFDENGNCFVVDRAKELIKVKGFQVAPAELESILRHHPDIAEAAVTSKQCPIAGERPIAFVVPRDGIRIDVEDVKRFVASKVAPYKEIKGVTVVASIPKGPSGKILRRNLKSLVEN